MPKFHTAHARRAQDLINAIDERLARFETLIKVADQVNNETVMCQVQAVLYHTGALIDLAMPNPNADPLPTPLEREEDV